MQQKQQNTHCTHIDDVQHDDKMITILTFFVPFMTAPDHGKEAFCIGNRKLMDSVSARNAHE